MLGFARALVLFLVASLVSAAAGAKSPLPSFQQLQQSAVQERLQALPIAPGGLFVAPAPARAPAGVSAEKSQAATAGVRRVRDAQIDPAYLRGMLGAEKLALTADGGIDGTPTQFALNLFDDAVPRIVPLDSRVNELGLTILHGTVVGGGDALFVIDNGRVTARIAAGDRAYAIMADVDGTHRVTELDRSAAPRGTDDVPPRSDVHPSTSAPLALPSRDLERPSATPTTLTMLMVYTASAAATIPYTKDILSLNVAYLNLLLANSRIDTTVRIVGIEQTSYTENAGTTLDDILTAFHDSVGDFARIQQIRAATGADLVSVFVNANADIGSLCGEAYRLDELDTLNAADLLHVTTAHAVSAIQADLDCSIGSTFSHEVGHNLGAAHDRYVVTSPPPGTYNYGYVDVTHKFQDVMAYPDKCDDQKVTCTELPYFSNPDLTYTGYPVGVAYDQPEAADASRKMRQMIPFVARFSDMLAAPTSPMLTVLVSGTGTVTSSSGGINCGVTCSASYAASQQVTLTPSTTPGWRFKQWDGACTGSGACTVTMSETRNVTATFVPGVTFGPVFSSANASSQSFIRITNAGSSAGQVTVTLADYATGAPLTTWTSPTIAAGAAPQYAISEIEAGIGQASKPPYYTASVRSDMALGYAQHVLWKPADGTLTNLSTCDTNVTAYPDKISDVHSSLLGALGYPSTVVVVRTASTSNSAQIGVYDARDGTRLGAYTTALIPGRAHAFLSVSSIENGAGVTPLSARPHYVLKIENGFSGFLQHLVNNEKAAVMTDMTTACLLELMPSPSATVAMLHSGPIYSTAQGSSQSFLRVVNTGSDTGTVAVTFRDDTTGTKLGQWISPSIPPNSAPQFPISVPEAALSGAKPSYYSAQIETQITGSFAHVLWKPANGTLTNLSTCGAGIGTNSQLVFAVHSSILGTAGYPSTVAITNTGSTAATASLGIYRAVDGTRLGTYVSASIPAGGQVLVPANAIEAGAGITPSSDVPHYVVRVENAFTGFLQHLLNNQQVAVLTDMTTVCKLPARSVTYTDCRSTTCPITLNVPVVGQVKEIGTSSNYTLDLEAGRTYTIEVKSAATNNGTLTRPYVYVFGPRPATTVVAEGGAGATAGNVRITYTPTVAGTYAVQVTTYVYPDNAGSFQLSVSAAASGP